MHKPETLLEKEKHKILWDFQMQKYPKIPVRRPDIVKKKKKEKKENLPNSGLYCPVRPQSENQRKRKKRQVLRPCHRTKKAGEQKSNGDTDCKWRTWNNPWMFYEEVRRVGNRRTNRDQPNYSIVEIVQNTEKSPGDLRRLAVTYTPMKDHQQTLAWTLTNNNNTALGNETHKLLLDFEKQTDHLIVARRPDRVIINKQIKKKKRICLIVGFADRVDVRIKLKESEKKDRYVDLARELKKLWNMRVTIIPIVIGAFVTVIKGLSKRLEYLQIRSEMESIQTTILLRTARIQRRVLDS